MKEVNIHTLCPEIKDCYIINEKGETWKYLTKDITQPLGKVRK